MNAIDLANLIFGVGGIVFVFALIPSLRNPKTQVPRVSSFTTMLVLYTFLFAYAELGTWFAFACDLLLAVAWTILFLFYPVRMPVPKELT